MSQRRLLQPGGPLVLIAVLVVSAVILVGVSQATPPTASAGTPATQEQRQQFVALIQRYRHVFFNGWATGDLSAFPTVFYNDPDEQLIPQLEAVMKAKQPAVDGALGGATTGPIGARQGLLAAEMADILDRRGSDAQWQQAEATARAQGREATLADMPDGRPPVMTPRLSDWVDKEIIITEALMQEDRATVTYVVDKGSTLFFHMHFRQVGGQWYITNYWVTGNP